MNAHLIVAAVMAVIVLGCVAFLMSPYKQGSYWRLWAICQIYSASLAFVFFLTSGLTQ